MSSLTNDHDDVDVDYDECDSDDSFVTRGIPLGEVSSVDTSSPSRLEEHQGESSGTKTHGENGGSNSLVLVRTRWRCGGR